MKNQWDQFGSQYETFSVWISDKEKQLEVFKSSSLPLEQQIITVKVQYFFFQCCCDYSMKVIHLSNYRLLLLF